MSPLFAPKIRPMYAMMRKIARLTNERVLSGMVVCARTRVVRNAPSMPRIEPITAPMSRRRLARRRRTSKRITATAKPNPVSAPRRCDRLNGRKWYPAAMQTIAKIARIVSMSQKLPTPPEFERDSCTDFVCGFSGGLELELRLYCAEVRFMWAPYESSYEVDCALPL